MASFDFVAGRDGLSRTFRPLSQDSQIGHVSVTQYKVKVVREFARLLWHSELRGDPGKREAVEEAPQLATERE
ncbi:hypothetical protein N780_14920 [Pontibacillus chungwhensis BH030062]|uniref:Uncharacterized protein n=1 Tax=Pontibacillus chungwhensis BH030062 TaxID=1385513 RepID=A0A0A2VGK4_9BACI|nr:hypothetical protein N780_14920 [Pontibacillus chungwhensis BH030062]